MHAADQVIVIYAGAKGYLDKVPIAQVQAAATSLLEFMKTEHADVRDKLIAQAELTGQIEDGLKIALAAFNARQASV